MHVYLQCASIDAEISNQCSLINSTVIYARKMLMTLVPTMVLSHRYQKTKIDCLRFAMCPLLAPDFQGFFFAAIYSTNETNKAVSMGH